MKFYDGKKEEFKLSGKKESGKPCYFTFNINENDCHTIYDVAGMTVVENGDNGWNIHTIVTILADNQGNVYSGSINRNEDRWVDRDQKPEDKSFPLHLTHN